MTVFSSDLLLLDNDIFSILLSTWANFWSMWEWFFFAPSMHFLVYFITRHSTCISHYSIFPIKNHPLKTVVLSLSFKCNAILLKMLHNGPKYVFPDNQTVTIPDLITLHSILITGVLFYDVLQGNFQIWIIKDKLKTKIDIHNHKQTQSLGTLQLCPC